MLEEDDWQPEMTGESILKVKVINFSNDVVDRNLEEYNSKPTPYQRLGDPEQSQHQPENQINDQPKDQNAETEQNLYDPLDDEHEQTWVYKTLQHSREYTRPLSCPGCFTPLCYSYVEGANEDSHIARKVVNCNYNPYPISANLQSLCNLSQDQMKTVTDKQLERIGELIGSHERNIDLKFQLQCTECQNIVGFYDSQQNHYHLTNLI